MKKIIIILLAAAFVAEIFWLAVTILKKDSWVAYSQAEKTFWPVQSIDTMKYSRDLASEKLQDVTFDSEIARQMRLIAKTGATHVAIATPYDEKFLPFLERWVVAARAENLNVWFRGNWSGWEGWFNYPKKMTRAEHLQKTENFILQHADLFVDGDIFNACPECENGGPGDPRHNNDVNGHRQFLRAEYAATKSAFAKINKKVASNYFSMNGDVARLIMDKDTTVALDGLVVIDHYVPTPRKLAADIHEIAEASGGKVVLGEWGVPIPDIHGQMTEKERAEWVDQALVELLKLDQDLVGMNYWLAVGGNTELWAKGAENSLVADALRNYYQPQVIYGRVLDELDQPIAGVQIIIGSATVTTDEHGSFRWRDVEHTKQIEIVNKGYASQKLSVSNSFQKIVLVKEKPSLSFKFSRWLRQIFN